MANYFLSKGLHVTTGGTDNHLFLVDLSLTHPDVTGLMVQEACDLVGITLNKNCVPNETRSPKEASGIRIGTAAMTTKGFTEEDFIETAQRIIDIIDSLQKNAK
jgi:glycine hydroxymethyltransferase